MKIVKQIDSKTRVVFKYHLPDFDYSFVLQRKKRLFWKCTASIYPSIFKYNTLDELIDWLLLKDANKTTEIDIANDLINKSQAIAVLSKPRHS